MWSTVASLFVCLCVVHGTVVINVYDDKDTTVRAASKLEQCEFSKCVQMCTNNGFIFGGYCLGDQCICNKNVNDVSEELAPETKSFEDCSPLNCDQTCRRIGFHGGVCVRGKCKCDILRSAFNDASIESAPEAKSLDDCNPFDCDQTCRRLSFHGGVCVRGKCKCDILRSAADAQDENNDAVEVDNIETAKLNEVNNDVQCVLNSQCKEQCNEVGEFTGLCVNGKCNCDGTKDEKLNKLLMPRAICMPLQCNSMCIRNFYKGGRCMYNSCYCYK